MKKFFLVIVLIMLISVTPAYCGTADDFKNLGENYKKLGTTQVKESALQERTLQIKEAELFYKLLNTRSELDIIIRNSNSIEVSLLKRFRDRLQFEVSYENRKDLKPVLDQLSIKLQNDLIEEISKKKIAYIYGNEINLLNGEWQNTPDGHRFWISSEFSDIVLSPAEFRKYIESSTTVFE